MVEVKIAVGSCNPVKLDSALKGIKLSLSASNGNSHFDSDFQAVGFNVGSGVSNQPIGDSETKLGATNRAVLAFQAYNSKHGVNANFSVGLEGGVAFTDNTMECFAWIVIYDGVSFGCARTAGFMLPPVISRLVREEWLELGDADDRVFGTTNNKQSGGTVSHLTNGVINRSEYYTHAVTLAFIPFLWPELYNSK